MPWLFYSWPHLVVFVVTSQQAQLPPTLSSHITCYSTSKLFNVSSYKSLSIGKMISSMKYLSISVFNKNTALPYEPLAIHQVKVTSAFLPEACLWELHGSVYTPSVLWTRFSGWVREKTVGNLIILYCYVICDFRLNENRQKVVLQLFNVKATIILSVMLNSLVISCGITNKM